MKLNLGSGTKKLEGYINIDNNANLKPDMICDLEKQLPFNDYTIDEILLDNVVEHLNADLVKLIVECKRILKPNGRLIIICPNCFDLRTRIEYLFGTFKARGGYHYDHRWIFKPSFLKNLLEYYGFDVNKVSDLFDKDTHINARKRL